MHLSRIGVMKRVAVGIILIAVVVFGFYSFSLLNLEFISNISSPEVKVITIYPGASAEDVSKDVNEVLEDEFVTVPNIKTVSSQSTNSLGVVTITFRDGVDPHDQLSEIRNRITDLEGDLPKNLSGPPKALVGGVDILPIVSFTIDGGNDLFAISQYVEKELKPQITKIPGVSSVKISGDEKMRVNVRLRLDDLSAKGISPLTVYQILSYSNVNLPVGTADYKSKTVDLRYDGTYSSVQEIADLPVGADESSHVIRLKDVADVSLSKEKPEYFTSGENGRQLLVEICKRADGNTIQIIKGVRKILKKSTAATHGAIRYNMLQDDARLVSASLKTVVESGVMGIIVSIVVVFLFIGDAMATLIIALSIPLSILMTFVAMKMLGISINLMSLSGMVVALGSIIGGAIVVLEQVYRYYFVKDNPLTLNHAIFRGCDEVTGSVLGSALTTIVVFVPIAMLKGLVGQVLHDVSMTFIFAMTASLVVAIIVVPFFLKIVLRENPVERKDQKQTAFLKFISRLEALYEDSIRWAVDFRKYILLICVVIAALTVYSFRSLSMAFIPSTDNDDFYLTVTFPAGYSLDETSAGMDRVRRLVAENTPEISNSIYFIGKEDDLFSSVATDNCAYGHIMLTEVKDRDRDIHDIILSTQKLLEENIPDATVRVSNGGFDRLVAFVSEGGGYGITLVGEDNRLLYDAAKKIEARLLEDPEVTTTSVSTSYDRRAAVMDMSYEYLSSLGITGYEAGMTSAILFRGVDVGNKFTGDDGERYEIHVYSDAEDAIFSDDLIADIGVVSQAGANVKFSSISEIREEKTLTQVKRKDRANNISITAAVTGESTTGVAARMEKYLAENPLPDGVETMQGGIGSFIADSIIPMITALAIAMFLVYIVMVLQFENYAQPLLIMMTVPFCLIGVILALVAFNSTLSLLSMLGIISLVGMVVNNGILIIDYINMTRRQKRHALMREKGIEFEDWESGFGKLDEKDERLILMDSIAPATASRLRPILMTTLSTMLGVVPMAISTGEGAEIYAPLGQSIAGGLLTSTLVTMYLIPVLYYLLERGTITRKYDSKITIRAKKFLRRQGVPASGILREKPESVGRAVRKIDADTGVMVVIGSESENAECGSADSGIAGAGGAETAAGDDASRNPDTIGKDDAAGKEATTIGDDSETAADGERACESDAETDCVDGDGRSPEDHG